MRKARELEERLRELAFLNSGVNIYLTDAREDPVRESHFNYEEWEAAGYDREFIEDYLSSNADSYNHPNAANEPRIPGIFQYYSVAEDELAKIYAGQFDAQTGADNIAAAWEKITDQIGRDNQIALYKASLGM